jgi:arginine exporter protein ArgO
MITFKAAAAGGVLAAAVLLGVSLHARGNVSDTTYLTFSGAVSLPGVTLGAGTYIFERADQNTPDIVRVTSRDRRQVYFMAFTRTVDRPRGLGNRLVLLGEAAAGTAPPIKAWFPLGDVSGHQFIYPER